MRTAALIRPTISIAALLTAIGGIAAAQTITTGDPDPMMEPDNSWISISGTASNISGDSFILNHENGKILVEVDDGDWFNEAAMIHEGDRVSVYGEIDDDMFERRSIEASSVFLPERGEYVFASAADEEAGYYFAPYYMLVEQPEVVTTYGDVTKIDGREFVLDTGQSLIRVDTAEMAYNPLDDEGYQKIEVGDRVSIAGDINDSFFDDALIDAHSIVITSNS